MLPKTWVKFIKWVSPFLAVLLIGARPFAGTAASAPIDGGSRGTAIFFEWLDDRFVVATDSIELHDRNPPTFDDCKIVKQGTDDNFFTVSGGVRSADITPPNHPPLHWDTQGTAASAYASVKGSKDPGKVADEWRRLILLQLQSLPDRERSTWEWIVRYNMFLFVGLIADGSIDARVASFRLEGKNFDIDVVPPPVNKLRSIGEGEKAAGTFLEHKTPEAKQEAMAWEQSLKSAFGVRTQQEFQTQLVMKVVDWVIKHPEGDQVGGVVEAVKLQPDSKIVWLRLCPPTGRH